MRASRCLDFRWRCPKWKNSIPNPARRRTRTGSTSCLTRLPRSSSPNGQKQLTLASARVSLLSPTDFIPSDLYISFSFQSRCSPPPDSLVLPFLSPSSCTASHYSARYYIASSSLYVHFFLVSSSSQPRKLTVRTIIPGVLAVSSMHSEPLNAFASLYAASSREQLFKEYPWIDPNVLKYYVIVHDVNRGDLSTSVFFPVIILYCLFS
jgi:hypothetical protein